MTFLRCSVEEESLEFFCENSGPPWTEIVLWLEGDTRALQNYVRAAEEHLLLGLNFESKNEREIQKT